MKKLRFLLLAAAVSGACLAVGCGDDDNPNNPGGDAGQDGTTPPPNPNPDGSVPDGSVPDGGNPDGGGPQTFPAYVQTLIETKTNDTGQPDLEAVWGALTDDDKYVYPATFFP
jgi:hypothetical protein